jgi:hypothetical protein
MTRAINGDDLHKLHSEHDAYHAMEARAEAVALLKRASNYVAATVRTTEDDEPASECDHEAHDLACELAHEAHQVGRRVCVGLSCNQHRKPCRERCPTFSEMSVWEDGAAARVKSEEDAMWLLMLMLFGGIAAIASLVYVVARVLS